MKNANIVINEKNVLKKRYRLRTTGEDGRSIETTIPPEVIEREARRAELSVNDYLNQFVAEWRYNDFRGLHLDFVRKELDEPNKDRVVRF